MIKFLSTVLSFLALLGTFGLSLAFLGGILIECSKPFGGHPTNWSAVCSYGFGMVIASVAMYAAFVLTATEEPKQ